VIVNCEATRPIESVELVADGQVIDAWHGEGSPRLTAKVRLRSRMQWLSARAFVDERDWEADGHSMESLMASGCIAFTNPVWVERD
jgi:hypothetical protein